MLNATYYEARIAPLSYQYVISRDGDPIYEANIDGDLVFTDSDGEEVFRVEDRIFSVEDGYHVVDSDTDQVLGRITDEIALFGRRWSILDEDGTEVATIRDKGKLGALIYEVGIATTLPMPTTMEIVLPSGQSVGTIKRTVGVTSKITIELDPGIGFDERLALGGALMLDQDDRIDREIGRRVGSE